MVVFVPLAECDALVDEALATLSVEVTAVAVAGAMSFAAAVATWLALLLSLANFAAELTSVRDEFEALVEVAADVGSPAFAAETWPSSAAAAVSAANWSVVSVDAFRSLAKVVPAPVAAMPVTSAPIPSTLGAATPGAACEAADPASVVGGAVSAAAVAAPASAVEASSVVRLEASAVCVDEEGEELDVVLPPTVLAADLLPPESVACRGPRVRTWTRAVGATTG